MQFVDAAKLSGFRKLSDGYVHADANVVRTGIQTYLGREVGRADLETVRIYRPESEVRDVKSVLSFGHTPITVGHPSEMVTADNWKKYAVGEVSTEAEWKDGKIRLPLILKDKSAIDLVENGTRELSAGYVCALDWTAGVDENGNKFDAVQRDIKINHVAIVPRGRAGAECRIGDEWGATPQSEGKSGMELKNVVIGDAIVQVAPDSVTVVEQLRDSVRVADTEAAKKDGEIADLKAKLADAETQLADTSTLDERAEARAELLDAARQVADTLEFKGLSDADIRRAVVTEKRGKEVIDGKSDDYVQCAFDILVEDAKAAAEKNAGGTTFKPGQRAIDPVRKALGDGKPPVVTLVDSQTAYENSLRDAWEVQKETA